MKSWLNRYFVGQKAKGIDWIDNQIKGDRQLGEEKS